MDKKIKFTQDLIQIDSRSYQTSYDFNKFYDREQFSQLIKDLNNQPEIDKFNNQLLLTVTLFGKPKNKKKSEIKCKLKKSLFYVNSDNTCISLTQYYNDSIKHFISVKITYNNDGTITYTSFHQDRRNEISFQCAIIFKDTVDRFKLISKVIIQFLSNYRLINVETKSKNKINRLKLII